MISKIKSNLPVILAFFIIGFQFWTVHYNYTGIINTPAGKTEVEHSTYSLPKFSDEWVAAGMARYAIENETLPIVNYLASNTIYPNATILITFNSIVTSFFWVTHLDPVFNFSVLAIILGLFTCLSSYVLLRKLGVDKFYSSITILLLPFIVNSGNLPGLWFVIPITVSLPFFLLGLSEIVCKRTKLSLVYMIISLLIYPPIIVFIAPVYLTSKKNIMYLVGGVGLVFLTFFLILNSFIPNLNLFEMVLNLIIRHNNDAGMISYPIWFVLPFLVLPFTILGIRELWKKKIFPILFPIIIGLSYWIFYLFYPKIFIIEYPRIVLVTSVLLLISTGLSFYLLNKYIRKYKYIILLIFLILSFFYPIGKNWKHFTLDVFNPKVTKPLRPTPPVNYAIDADDLRIFEGIHDINFISVPWKALGIATVTNNDPMESKGASITVNIVSYNHFMKSSCEDKTNIVRDHNVSYVYSTPFDCPGFEITDTSYTGLIMYKVNK